MSALLQAEAVSRQFSIRTGMFRPRSTLHAVNGVDLSVERGAVLGIVGESGCGKSTLARMLLGLTPPSEGAIKLDGQDIRQMDRRALARRGRCLMVGGTLRTLLRMLTVGPVLGVLTGTRLGVLFVRQGPRQFTPLADLCAAGDVEIHVDSTFSFTDVPAALALHGEGRALGKVVVSVRDAAG